MMQVESMETRPGQVRDESLQGEQTIIERERSVDETRAPRFHPAASRRLNEAV